MMAIELETAVLVGLVVVLAYTVFGLTGFGSSITAMPLLVQLIPLHTAVAMMLIFDLAGGLLLGLKNRRVVERRELLRLVPMMLVGMGIGIVVLVNAPERLLLLTLGGFILAYSAWSLLFNPRLQIIRGAWAVPIGIIGGVFTALFGTGGPIYTIYLARRLPDKLVLRATISSLIFISGLSRLVLFTGAGLYRQHGLLSLAAVLLPFALGGLYLGNHLHGKLAPSRVVQVIWAILIGGGVSLILRNW
jgi:uncharacterized membrane protein YfcA